MKTNDVIGLGNALMDFLVKVDDQLLEECKLRKGEFNSSSQYDVQQLMTRISQLWTERVPGGCAANTLRGIAYLGGTTILCAAVGQDEHGDHYISEIKRYGVVPKISRHTLPTGKALTLITPDSERTFSAHLGAAECLTKEDVSEADIAISKILYLEGYQLEKGTTETVLYAIELAKKHGTLVAMDLSDPGLIRRNKQFLCNLVREKVDILFVNELEALEFTGKEEEEALLELSKMVDIAVVKLGKLGSLVYGRGEIHYIQPVPAKAVDTTGAGDSYAAGFLYGMCKGYGFNECGRIGSELAAKVVERVGVKFE